MALLARVGYDDQWLEPSLAFDVVQESVLGTYGLRDKCPRYPAIANPNYCTRQTPAFMLEGGVLVILVLRLYPDLRDASGDRFSHSGPQVSLVQSPQR